MIAYVNSEFNWDLKRKKHSSDRTKIETYDLMNFKFLLTGYALWPTQLCRWPMVELWR